MRLRASGFSFGPIDESYSERELFVGPNGAGKTARLRAVELACNGFVAALGKTPGAAAVLAPDGQLVVSLELGGRNTSLRVHSTTRKVDPLDDVACRTLALDLDGSAEKTRAFLGAHVRPSDDWTEARVVADLAAAGIPNATILGGDLLGSLGRTLQAQRETSKDARAQAKFADAAAVGAATSGAAVDVTVPGSSRDLEEQRHDLLVRSAAIDAKLATADSERRSRGRAAEALAQAKRRLEGLEAEIDPALAAPSDEDLTNLEKAKAEADARVTSIRGEAGKCGTCGQPFPGIAARLRGSEDIARDAAFSITDATRQRGEAATWRANHERALAEARGAVQLQEASFNGLPDPTDTEALMVEGPVIVADLAKVSAALVVARRREEAKAHAARLQTEAATAKERLEKSLVLEDGIRKVRDAVMASAVGKLATSLARVCELLGGVPVIDLGDDERDPSLGLNRAGVVVPLAALSAGERACMAAAIAGALLEQASAPRARRVLLVEAEAVGQEAMPALLCALHQLEVGVVLVARHGDGAGLATPGWCVRALGAAVPA